MFKQVFNKRMILLVSLLLVGIATVITILVTQSSIVHADGELKLSTIHHVYLDDVYLGSIKDKSVVDQHISDQLEELEQTDENYTYGTEQELSYIPERVFSVDIDIDRLLARLDQQLVIEIQATTLQFGDDVFAHFASETEAEQAIYDYISLYVDEDVLNNLAEQVDQDEDLDLAVGDSIVTDVSLSEEVTLFETFVLEEDLIEVAEAVRLLNKGTLEDIIHDVAAGDTLYSIAKQYDLTEATLLELNEELEIDGILQIGQEINVTDYVPMVDVIVHQEELKEETIKYQKKTEQTDDLYRGVSKQKQEGSDGKKEVHRMIEKVNGKVVDREVLDEAIIKEVQHEITLIGTKVIPSRGTGDFIRPAIGGYISSGYGPRWGSFHRGVDFARPSNRNIIASDNGVVEKVSYGGGYGRYIVINHNNGYKTLYAHLSSTSVRVGQTVPRGTKIGVMGSTGRSTGMHLHFEVLKNGVNINPMNVLN